MRVLLGGMTHGLGGVAAQVLLRLGHRSERRVIGSEYLPTVGCHWPFNGYVMGVKAIP